MTAEGISDSSMSETSSTAPGSAVGFRRGGGEWGLCEVNYKSIQTVGSPTTIQIVYHPIDPPPQNIYIYISQRTDEPPAFLLLAELLHGDVVEELRQLVRLLGALPCTGPSV